MKVRDGTGIEMTLCAGNICMSAFELEGVCVVIKVPEAVQAVVTGDAVSAEGEEMRLGEGYVHVAVTGLARVRGEGLHVFAVAVPAGDRFARLHPHMFVQRKTERVMWKGVIPQIGKGGVFSAMFMVAVAAGKVGCFLGDGPMQLGNIAHLTGNIRMTFQAAVRHRGTFPEGGVTFSASPNLRM